MKRLISFTRPRNRGLSAAALCGLMLLAACEQWTETSSGGGVQTQDAAPEQPALTPITLNAFARFNCTSNWTERDGAMGLAAGSGNGRCRATFPGLSGKYRVQLVIQTEFDGAPVYRLSLNNQTIRSGTYPLSQGRLICDCPNWRQDCPDGVVALDAGVRQVNTGDTIEFYGEEVYPCGGGHGAYAKWHRVKFIPAE